MLTGRDNQATQRRHRPDYMLVLISVVLLVVGLIVIYAISPGLAIQKHVSESYFVTKQLLAIGIGGIAFGVMATVPYQTWQRFQKLLIVAAVLATLVALLMPVSAEYPAHRWIRFGGLSLQSVELIKVALLIWLGSFLAKRSEAQRLWNNRATYKYLAAIILALGLVIGVAQKDLGSTGVMLAMMGVMCFIAGLPLKRLVIAFCAIMIGVALLVLPYSYRRDRLLTFTHPEKNCQTTSYQACQALIAVGSGGLFGKGLTHSVQDYGYLPEASNDSIFAILAEKFGFVGVTILICIFTAFFIRLKNITEKAPDKYSRYIVAGILGWLSTQSIINIGAMIGLLPLKGITLPFISYGGTSIIFVTAALGLAFNISRYTTYGVNTELEGNSNEDHASRRGNRRPHYTQLSRRP
ncbi:MAG: stage V sporulation protein E [Candidatus Saccharimonadales bacterium]